MRVKCENSEAHAACLSSFVPFGNKCAWTDSDNRAMRLFAKPSCLQASTQSCSHEAKKKKKKKMLLVFRAEFCGGINLAASCWEGKCGPLSFA